MNILYIDHYAGSIHHGRSFRIYYLAKNWLQDGHKVTVVAATYSHLRNKQPETSGVEEIDGITYLWLKTPRYKGNGIMRVLSMIVFMMQLFLHLPQILRLSHPNFIIGSTVYLLDMFPAWVMKKLSGAKLVFELHDLWPLSPMELGGMSKWHPFIMMLRVAEWWTYKVSDKIISILPYTHEYMSKFGIKKEQVKYIPNGIMQEDWHHNPAQPVQYLDKVKQLKAIGKFIICYAGSHGISNDLMHLIKAAEILKKTVHDVHILFIGDGPVKHELMRYAQKIGLDNVEFLDRVSKREITQLLTEMNALFFAVMPKNLYKYGIGLNKLFDYMMAQQPIIGAWNDKYDMLQEVGCGITIEPADPQAIAEAIIMISKLPEEIRTMMGLKGKQYVVSHHNYRFLAQEFMNFLLK
jgi:glycosyltransferase involved in cell wall biosynthesis